MPSLENGFGNLKASNVWHPDVQNNHVGTQTRKLINSLSTASCFADNFDIVGRLEYELQAPANHRIIIH